MKQTTKRFLGLLISVMLIVGALVVFFEFIQPAYDDAQSIKAQQISLREFLGSEGKTITQVKDIISAYQGQGQVQQAVSASLPITEDLAGALAQLYGLAQTSGLVFNSVAVSVAEPTSFSAGSEAGGNPATGFVLQKQVGSINFQLRLIGPYQGLKTFMSKLETNLRIFDVKLVGIQPAQQINPGKGQAQQDVLNYDVSVVAYYQGR